MKSWVLHGVNDFRMEEMEVPEAGSGEVLVAVKAAGICGSDIQRVYETGAHMHPIIIGHEFSGIVAGVGAAVDTRWLGRRVGIYPLIPCGKCIPCRQRRYEMCRSYGYLGSRRNGGFAEYAAIPAGCLAELPDGVSLEEAAMLEPMAVAVHAMRRVMPGASETVVICGLGTIGLMILMFLREAGIRKILAIGNKDFQRRTALKIGLEEECFFDTRSGNVDQWIAEKTAGMGADVFFECVGRNETIAQAVDNTAPGGRVCLVGNPYSDIKLEKDIYWKILRNQLTLTGTWNSSFTDASRGRILSGERGISEDKSSNQVWGGLSDDWQYVLERLSQGRVKPTDLISHRFLLGELEQGFRIMRDKTEEYGKIMCSIA
jgi:L-iditol 2-dehydrogenase